MTLIRRIKIMNKMKRLVSAMTALTLLLLTCFSTVLTVNADSVSEGECDYYVALSTQNYAIKNANKLTRGEDGNYYLNKISLSSDVKFYVTDGGGVKYYAASGDEMKVDDAKACDYNIKFSPSLIFTEESGGYVATGCHITYGFYTPAEYSVDITVGENTESTSLVYNPFFTDYELYYVSSIYLAAGSAVKYGEEVHTLSDSGNYRILFTPTVERDGKLYAFDEDGGYGSGDGYTYNIYIEDAPEYYVSFESGVSCLSVGNNQIEINGKQAYPLSRYEKNTSQQEYRIGDFFVAERDESVKYCIYEREPTGNFRLIDSDNDEDTDVSKITVDDAGWYELSLLVTGDKYTSLAVWSERSLGGYYILGDFNGYGFNSTGGVDIDDKFAFNPVEQGDDDYNEDYEQYILYFTLTQKDVKENNVEFYISDGENKYKNGTDYVSLNVAGRYKILFSDEHVYSQGRNYRFTLINEKTEGREIEISTVEQFNDFARKCTESADYSMNLSVYLTCDLDFASETFTPVKSFSGRFYGGYHTLKNITLSGDDTSAFETLTRYARIERLRVENLSIDSKDGEYTAFIGQNYGTVQKVTVSGNIVGDNYVGGVVAYNGISRVDDSSATIDSNNVVQKGLCEGCVNNADVIGKSNVGGVVGFNSGDVSSCVNNGEVAPYTETKATLTNIGGVSGFSAGKLADCSNYGRVGRELYGMYVGGVVGFGTGENYFCSNYGEVQGLKYVGGVIGGYGNVTQDNNDHSEQYGGLDYETIIKNYFSGEEEDDSVLTGENYGQEYLQNYGPVTAGNYVAGVLGNSNYQDLVIRNSLSVADVTGVSGGYAGGILGNGTITVEGCFSSGTVKASGSSANYVGGIAGSVGAVENCMSTATVIGSDYVGGIAGNVKNHIRSSYTNCTVISEDENSHVGLIAGNAESYNQSLHSFADEFKYNYYIGTQGGIGRMEYAERFNFAAASITSEKLLSDGSLSIYLNEFFDHEYWQGGEENSYPVLSYMLNCAEIDDIDGEEELFARHAEKLRRTMYDNAKIFYTVTFMEWNKDNGDLCDDGEVQYGNFDVIYTVRVEKGTSAPEVVLKYAEQRGNRWIYEGTDSVYSVTLFSPENVRDNLIVYAQYTEMISTVSTPDGKVLAEGLFDARTELRVVRIGEYIKFEFTIDGQKVDIDLFKVKYLKETENGSYEVYSAEEGLVQLPTTEYGSYVCFDGNGGYFKIISENHESLSALEISLIAVSAALLVLCFAAISVAVVRHRRTDNVKGTK